MRLGGAYGSYNFSLCFDYGVVRLKLLSLKKGGDHLNTVEKIVFIDELFNAVKDEILKDVSKYPENWDGIELRWLIREKFNQVVWGGFQDKREKRFRDFENECIVNNYY